MSTSIVQNNAGFENGMIIHLLAFALPKSIVKDNEKVRVSITSMPDGNKQHFTIEGKKMLNANHVFSLNVTKQTKRIVFVFRKKILFSDNPIIASATIHLKDFKNIPHQQIKGGIIKTEIKTFNIFYPLPPQKDEVKKARRVIGQMRIQLSSSSSLEDQSLQKSSKVNNKKNEKIHKTKSNNKQKVKSNYEKLSEENDLCNSYLL